MLLTYSYVFELPPNCNESLGPWRVIEESRPTWLGRWLGFRPLTSVYFKSPNQFVWSCEWMTVPDMDWAEPSTRDRIRKAICQYIDGRSGDRERLRLKKEYENLKKAIEASKPAPQGSGAA